MKNLLLIDSTVKDYQTFVDSVNADTVPFVYGSSTTVPFIELPEDILSDPSYVEMPREPYVHKQATTRQSIFDFLGNTTIDRIGIVSTMSARVFLEGETFFEETNVQFVLELIQRYQVKNMDYLACNTLQYQEWNDYFSRISETGVLVGASNNKTGNLQYGGDWILESTNQDVELIYFTNTIEHYKYLLDTSDTGYSTVVIKDTYNVWGSGSNAKNQLGNLGSTTQTTNYSTFRKLSNANSCNRVVCSVNFTMFTSYEKAVGFWSGNNWLHGSGSNEDGQLSPYSGIQFTLVGPSANGQGYRYAMGAGEFFSMSQDDEPITKGQGIPDYAYKQFYNASWIACGRAHSLLIHKVSSYLYGTGLNNNYQLGMGNTSTYTSYVIVSSNKYVANACGSYHSLALRDDGTIWGAGLNSSNQLGSLYGTNTTFVQISPANKIFVAIAAGETHSLALNIDGTVWGTGSNAYNQLGTMYGSSTTFAQLTPTGTVFRQVSCGSYGSYHSLALDSNNNLWGTGLNATNQLGSAYGSSTTFVQILTGVAVLSNISPSYIDPIYISYLFTLSANTNIIPGNQLTIYGTNLASVAYVTYRGIQVMAASFTSISQFNIVFTVPTGTTVSNFLTINVGGVNYPATNSAINTVTSPQPTITTITQAANGLVTINGNNFNTPTVTMTGGFTVNNFSKVSSTQLTFNSNSFIGSTTFTVTDSGNAVSFSQSFPTITTITQAANGVVTINGTNFNTPTVTMTGGFTPNNFSKVSASQLTFTSSSFIGSTTFTVTDSGSTVSLIKTFPTITSFTPGSGTKNVIVTITGSNLSNVTTVVFGTISAISPFISANTITANAPPNVKSVFITLSDNEGNSVTTTTSFTYNTNSTLFTTNVSNNNLLTQLSLTDGVADTGIIQIGSALTTTNFSGPVYGTTVNASDNSSTLATTAFVKSQGYVTSLTVYAQTAVAQTWSALQNFSTITASSPALSDNSSSVATTAFVKGQGYVTSLTGYAQLAAAQTWSAIQTFNSGVLSSKYDALNSSSALSLGSNLATGIVNIGTSTSITNLSGTTYGVTVNASDNSSSVATTAFVKAQNYSTGSANLSSYAQLNASQTWTAPQTFNSVIYSSMYEALNTSADVYLGNNITTGNVYIGAGLNAGSVTLIGGNPQSYTYLQGLSTATGPLDISENSTRIATTAFVKAQNYAKTAVAQTWSAAQTFSSGITATLTGSSKISVPVNVGNIDIMYGNTNTSASLGYSFNTKSSTASGTNQPVQLFSLVNTTPTGGVQYFELNITGHVASLGATGQRLAIWIYGVGTGSNPGGNSVFLLGFNIGSGSFLNVDFTPNTAILRFTPPGSNGYSLCATLTSYPTMGSPGNMTDWAVTAL